MTCLGERSMPMLSYEESIGHKRDELIKGACAHSAVCHPPGMRTKAQSRILPVFPALSWVPQCRKGRPDQAHLTHRGSLLDLPGGSRYRSACRSISLLVGCSALGLALRIFLFCVGYGLESGKPADDLAGDHLAHDQRYVAHGAQSQSDPSQVSSHPPSSEAWDPRPSLSSRVPRAP